MKKFAIICKDKVHDVYRELPRVNDVYVKYEYMSWFWNLRLKKTKKI